MLKIIRFAVVVAFISLCCAAFASAEPRFDLYFGMGTMRDDSGLGLTDSSGNLAQSSLDGVFGTFGGGVMFKPSFGVGAEVAVRFRQGDFGMYGYRPVFYDFNGIWTPGLGKHVMPEIQAGLGGLNLRFYNPNSYYYDYYTGQYSNFAGSSNHFQLHVAVGLRVYITDSVFIRPQVDYHWVRNMTEFNSSSVPAFTIAIGYSSAR